VKVATDPLSVPCSAKFVSDTTAVPENAPVDMFIAVTSQVPFCGSRVPPAEGS
jgi:hypothetical protein